MEPTAQHSGVTSPECWVAALPNSVSLEPGPDLGDHDNNCRHSSSSDPSPQATPTQVSRHFRARHHLFDEEKSQGEVGTEEP